MTRPVTARRRAGRGRSATRHDGGSRLDAIGRNTCRRTTRLGNGRDDDGTLRPPQPPLALTPAVACDPQTDMDVLWHIAREAPELRRWLAANPKADAALLEYVAQAGGPGVKEALTVLLGE